MIDEAKAAGVYVFGGGIDEGVPPVLVAADGAVAEGGYSCAPPLDGGFTVLDLSLREEAVAWAARMAKACRCDQELRVIGFDPRRRPYVGRRRSAGRRHPACVAELPKLISATGTPDEEWNLTGALRQRLAREARKPHHIGCAGRLTPAR